MDRCPAHRVVSASRVVADPSSSSRGKDERIVHALLPRGCLPRTQRSCAAAVACGPSRADRAGGSVRHTSEPQPLNFAGPPAVRFPALMVSVSVCSGTAVAVPLNVTRVSAYGSEHE